LDLNQVLGAMQKLPTAQRAVIALISARGMTYEETAAILGCKLGTIKSRLNRADAALRALLGPEFPSARVDNTSTRKATSPAVGLSTAAERTRPLKMPTIAVRLDPCMRSGRVDGSPRIAGRAAG
jgi:hypothetical protein